MISRDRDGMKIFFFFLLLKRVGLLVFLFNRSLAVSIVFLCMYLAFVW